MRILKLLAVALLAVALLGLPAAPRAAAAEPPLPDIPGPSRTHPCTAYGEYCFNPAWRNKAIVALKWSDRHRSTAARRPVPYPAATTWNLVNKTYVVYVVRYGSKKAPRTYKFGITRKVPWTSRPKDGVRQCKKEKAKKFSNCRFEWVAVANASHGLYWARYLEASMIKDYEGRNWKCPPGQTKSCR